MFEKKAATFAQRQRLEDEFASRDAGAPAGVRRTTTGRPATRRVPRRAASGGAPPYSPLKSSASGAGAASAHGRRPLRAASSPETGVSYRPPESENLSFLPAAAGGGVVGGVGGVSGGGGGGGNDIPSSHQIAYFCSQPVRKTSLIQQKTERFGLFFCATWLLYWCPSSRHYLRRATSR